jgi:hypothetical protein
VLVLIAALPLGGVVWAVVGKLLGAFYELGTLSDNSFYSVPFGGEESLTNLEIAASILFWWILCAVVISRVARGEAG